MGTDAFAVIREAMAEDGAAMCEFYAWFEQALGRERITELTRIGFDRVYLHQFEEQTLSGVPGLVGKPMRPSNGYAGESVWYDALSPNPFVAKCVAPVAEDGVAQCVRTVYLPSGIAAIYTFDATILQSWRQFDVEMERWLAPTGAW